MVGRLVRGKREKKENQSKIKIKIINNLRFLKI